MVGLLSKEIKKRILLALYRYYLEDITFEKAAEKADVPLYLFIKFVNDNCFPIVHTEADVREGIKKVMKLAKKEGIKLPMPV